MDTLEARNIIIKLAAVAHAHYQLADQFPEVEVMERIRATAQQNGIDLNAMSSELRQEAAQIMTIAEQFKVVRPLSQDEAEPFTILEARDPQEAAYMALELEASRMRYLADAIEAAKLRQA